MTVAQIFLSYSRVDLAFVERLYSRLQHMFPDIPVWYDKSPHGLLGGDNWWQTILDAIGMSTVFIYILSNESVNSIYCQAEFAEARRLQKRIITIQSRDRTEIPDGLGDIQFIDMKNGPEDLAAGDELVASIRRQLEQTKKQRALWQPATARPRKEALPIRAANTPEVDTLPLKPPIQEEELKKRKSDPSIKMTGALVVGALTLLVVGIVILPGLRFQSDADAVQAGLEITQAHLYTSIPLNTQTPTELTWIDQQPLQQALTPVAHNADWSPVERDFDGVAMVLVPAGHFTMGSDDTGQSNERQAHEQIFSRPYWIDKYEVTNGQFARFKGEAAYLGGWTNENRPREQISRLEAQAFCAKRGARLPTEREWEYAARGPDNLMYPWGNDWNEDNVVWRGNSNQVTAEVGSRPAGVSWVGAEDLSGNVWEWVSSLYQDYPYDEQDGRETEGGDITDFKVILRGGSWLDPYIENFRTSFRDAIASRPDNGSNIGFRCARSDESPLMQVTSPASLIPVTYNADWSPVERDFDGVAMVLVPPGRFTMGSNNSEQSNAHEQVFETLFWIDKYEVTNEQFAQFKGVAGKAGKWIGSNRPREQITWFEARDFCLLRVARLATEREWEYAARGPDNLEYPWGSIWNPDNLVWGTDQTADVGSRPAGASWVGAQDLAGNVWEWVSSWYQGYPYNAADGRETDVSNKTYVLYRVMRGGPWDYVDPVVFRAASRAWATPGSWYVDVGFRCVRSFQ
jgi:formylglycine-generating enzyme required for sulfatase activity